MEKAPDRFKATVVHSSIVSLESSAVTGNVLLKLQVFVAFKNTPEAVSPISVKCFYKSFVQNHHSLSAIENFEG